MEIPHNNKFQRASSVEPSAVINMSDEQRHRLNIKLARQQYDELPKAYQVQNTNNKQSHKEKVLEQRFKIDAKELSPPALNYMKLLHTYRASGYFGELALENDAPRAARIVAATDCHFAVLSAEDYTRCLENLKKVYE